MGTVLVTDANERAALAVIRSLGKRGIRVIAADSTSYSTGFFSKYCSDRILYPSPIHNKSRFIKSLLSFIKRNDVDLIIPVTDFTMIPIVENLDAFEKYTRVAAPPPEIAIKAYDKFETMKLAKRCNIPCPETFLVEDMNSLREIARNLPYPIVIKPRMKVFWKGEKAVILKVTSRNYAYNPEDLLSKYSDIYHRVKDFVPQDFFVVQEYVRGKGFGVSVLLANGNPYAVFCHERLREYPITGGASTYRVSTWNRELVKYAITLLREMNWQGVAMVEFKLDRESGEARLIEVNGRFWGSLALAINSGVDFPFLLYLSVVEKKIRNNVLDKYKIGVSQRWLIPGDILWLLSLIKHRKGVLSGFKEFFSSSKDDIICLNDLQPFIGSLLSSTNLLLEMLRRKRNVYGETIIQ